MEVGIDRVIAVIVLYNTVGNDSIALKSLARSLASKNFTLDTVVYDNRASPQEENGIFDASELNIHYYQDYSNSGLSKAYNLASRIGIKLKKEWILLLDEDTDLPVDSVDKYLEALNHNCQVKLFAPILKQSDNLILSPCKYFFKRGFPLSDITLGENRFKDRAVLNSGLLINLTAYSDCGGHNELINLDFSDFNFIERFKKSCSTFFVVDLICTHNFSNEQKDVFLLNNRFEKFCYGAANSHKKNVIDELQYLIVVFLRASTLFLRTKNIIFYKTFIKNYLRI
ncbi:MAG: rhamnosyltransferase [Sphingobacteriales bacterium]|nr:rhamnosyltransferase [Sphingobacteriales bacterium]